jgi:hypothetical protein
MSRRFGGGAAFVALWAALAAAALTSPIEARDARVDAQVRRLKALQYRILLSEETVRLDAPRAKRRKGSRAFSDPDRSRPAREDVFTVRPRFTPPFHRGAAVSAPVNVRLNDASPALTTQSEVSLAAIGSQMVAVWNDGGISGGTNGIGSAYSLDGGGSWVAGGALPSGGGVAVWISDPVAIADPPRASLYVVGLVITDAARNGVAVVRGAFQGGGFAWGTPQLVRAVRDTFPDKPWVATDTTNGMLYVSYTSFFRKQGRPSDEIESQRTLVPGGPWSLPAKLSLDEEDGLVQGSRPAVGPDGELHVVWKTIDTTAAAGGLDAIHLRTSRDHGATFGTLATVARLYTNFCSGPPGFNRGSGLGFPSIAIDGGAAGHRGRIYVGWEESLDFYDDPVATAGDVVEAEPNDVSSGATPFALGQTVRAHIDPVGDTDWFRFEGAAGQTALVILDSLETRLDVSMRLWCDDGATALALSEPLNVRERTLLFTLPRTGDYFVTVAPHNDSTGSYRLSTGLAVRGAERGRDQRDVFVAHSDDGLAWSAPARASDSPTGYDDWLPELAVAGDGKPYVAWYDWRAGDPAECGAASTLYLSRSDDGGDSWHSLGAVGESPTVWSSVYSNLIPNMGDYVSLWADGRGVFPCWADGRNGDPDVFLAMEPLPTLASLITPSSAQVGDGGVQVRWVVPPGPPLSAVPYRRVSGGEWSPLPAITSDGQAFQVDDADVQPGFRYTYRLGLVTTDGEAPTAEQVIDVPQVGATMLAIERVQPNPSSGTLTVWFSRPDLEPAKLEVMDLGGRRVFSRELSHDYGVRGVFDLGSQVRLRPGLYQILLVHGDRVASAKAVVLR